VETTASAESVTTVAQAVRAEPGSAASRWLARWSEHMDDGRWRALMRELEDISRAVAPAYRDVAEADDVLGDLVLLSCERWLPRYLAELSEGRARASLRSYLLLRIKGHLAEERRKRRRRRRLLQEALPPRLGATGDVDHCPGDADPQGEVEARELLDRAASDPELAEILRLRMQGFSHAEIAARTRLSRPTVTRRLTAIGALLVALGVVALLLLPRAAEPPQLAAPEAPVEAPGDARDQPAPFPALGACMGTREAPAPIMTPRHLEDASTGPYVDDPRMQPAAEARFRWCWEGWGPTGGAAAVTVAVRTDADGRVVDARVSGAEPRLAGCLRDHAVQLRFPEHPDAWLRTRVGPPPRIEETPR